MRAILPIVCGGVSAPPPSEEWGIRPWFGMTMNIDGTGPGPQWWARVAKPDFMYPALQFVREGEGHGLPAVSSGSWNKSAWVQALENVDDTPWFKAQGRQMLLHQIAYGINDHPAEGETASLEFQQCIKKRCYLVTTQQEFNVIGVMAMNEPERPSSAGNVQGAYSYLGGPTNGGDATSRELTKYNLATCYRAMYQQLHQLPGGAASNYLAPASDISVVGPAFAEPTKTGQAMAAVNIYDLFSETDILDHLDVLGSHHHQGIGNAESTWRYGTDDIGRPPLDKAVSLYHLAKAAQQAKPDHGLPMYFDESSVPMNIPVGISGWGAEQSDTQDLLRKYRSGAMVCSLLALGPSAWWGYANRTGDTKYRYEKEDGPTWTMFDSWAALMQISDPTAYDIANLVNGVIPITVKPWQLYYDPRTICVHCPTRSQPVNTYASGLPPFAEWQQTTFRNGLVILAAGVEKVLHRPVWLRQIRRHTASVDLRVTETTGGKARLVAMGYDKTNGTLRTVSSEAVSGGGWTTCSLQFTPKQHIKPGPNPAYVLLEVESNGIGAVEVANWHIT